MTPRVQLGRTALLLLATRGKIWFCPFLIPADEVKNDYSIVKVKEPKKKESNKTLHHNNMDKLKNVRPRQFECYINMINMFTEDAYSRYKILENCTLKYNKDKKIWQRQIY